MKSILQNEVWKPVKGYEDRYKVSNLGRVKANRTWLVGKGWVDKERIISAIDHGNGYLYVTLNKDHKRKNYYIHRLVADAFIPNPENKNEVNHIDYDKTNNVVSNLEWCTRKENLRHSNCHMHGRKFGFKSSSGEPYIYLRKGRYRICIDGVEYPTQPTLIAAVLFRDSILREKGVVIDG